MQTSGHWGFSVPSVILGTTFSCPTPDSVWCNITVQLHGLPVVSQSDSPPTLLQPFLSPGLFCSSAGASAPLLTPRPTFFPLRSFLCPFLRTHNLIAPSCRAEFLSTVSLGPRACLYIWLSPDGPPTPCWCWPLSCL